MNDTYRSKNRINNKVWIFNDENKYLIVKYEDMLKEPLNECKSILNYFSSIPLISEAIV